LVLFAGKKYEEEGKQELLMPCRMIGGLTEPLFFFYLILKAFLEAGEPDTFGGLSLVFSPVLNIPTFEGPACAEHLDAKSRQKGPGCENPFDSGNRSLRSIFGNSPGCRRAQTSENLAAPLTGRCDEMLLEAV